MPSWGGGLDSGHVRSSCGDVAGGVLLLESSEELLHRVVPHDERGCYRVADVDLGHTVPRHVLPYGGPVTVDAPDGRTVAHLG